MFPFLVFFALTASVIGQASGIPTASSGTQAQIRSRLIAYEQQVDSGRADPKELVAIAGLVVRGLQASRDTSVLIDACASDVLTFGSECESRLWRIARDPRAKFEHRAAAASVMAERKAAGAAAYLSEIATAATVEQLTAASASLRFILPDRSAPVFRRMLTSPSPAAHAAACRVLGQLDTGDSRAAIADYLASAPRGTQPWYVCTLAAARLGDPIAQRTVGGIVNYLSGADLVEAGEILQLPDPERAANLLMLAGRQSAPLVQMLAADRLAPLRPDVSLKIMTPALDSDRADLRAAALSVHRRLNLEPTRDIRERLLDPDPLVRLRAAEAIISRADRLGLARLP